MLFSTVQVRRDNEYMPLLREMRPLIAYVQKKPGRIHRAPARLRRWIGSFTAFESPVDSSSLSELTRATGL
jgi:hypothetical protein